MIQEGQDYQYMKQKYTRDIQTQTNKHKLSFWKIRKPKRKSEKTHFIIKISLSVESEVIEKDILKELDVTSSNWSSTWGTMDSQDFIQCWKGFFEIENESVLSAD